MMDDSGIPSSPSLFVVVYSDAEPCVSILQLETPPKLTEMNADDLKEHEVCLGVPKHFPPIAWGASDPLIKSDTEDLYLLPGYCTQNAIPLHGYKFSFSTRCLQTIPLHRSFNNGPLVLVLNLRGRIYVMTRIVCPSPYFYDQPEANIFECYDPETKLWKFLKPFPCFSSRTSLKAAAAVLDDIILFNFRTKGIWAYDVCQAEWYPVHVDDIRCYSIVGFPVAKEIENNTIYALTCLKFNFILALIIEKKVNGLDTVFKCSLHSMIKMEGLKPMFHEDEDKPILIHVNEPYVRRNSHLVHLEKDNFCLVQKGYPLPIDDEYTPIHVSYMKLNLVGKPSMTVLGARVFKTRGEDSGIQLCFSLPKDKIAASEEPNPSTFLLDPLTKDSASEQEDKTDLNPKPEVVKPLQEYENVTVTLPRDSSTKDSASGQEEKTDLNPKPEVVKPPQEYENVTVTLPGDSITKDSASAQEEKTDLNQKPEVVRPLQEYENVTVTLSRDKEGYSILVTHLPNIATSAKLKKVLKEKFGSIKRDGITLVGRKKGKWSARVEFEFATSKQSAIEAKTINMGDFTAWIQPDPHSR